MSRVISFFKQPFFVFISILIPVAILGLLFTKESIGVTDKFKSLRENTIPALDMLDEINDKVSLFRIYELLRLLSSDEKKVLEIEQNLGKYLKDIKLSRDNYCSHYQGTEAGSLCTQLDIEIKEYMDAHAELMATLHAKDFAKANELAFSKTEKEYMDIGLVLDAIKDKQAKIATDAEKSIIQDGETTQKVAVLLFFLTVLIAGFTAFVYARLMQGNQKMNKQLLTDTLTGLPNRISLIQMLKKIQDGMLLLINIDDFSQINDFYGYEVGDEVLVWLANKLKSEDEASYELYRMPSDEFAIFLDSGDEAKNQAFIAKIAELLFSQTLICNCFGQDILLRFTMGIASGSGESLLTYADFALKRAKNSRQHYIIYDESMNLSKYFQKNIEWAQRLNKAINEDRIVVYYQPIINNQTNKASRYESLVRLIGEDGKVISPFEFLDIAKKSRLYYNITHIVISKTFEFFKNRSEKVSINLSFEDIDDSRTRKYILAMLEQSGIAERIIFEILESEGIENFETVAEFVKQVQALGASVAIDDFGSGYSNFDVILKLNINILKIDGSLIKNINTDENARRIVKTIVGFAKELGLKVVAEFVHSAEVQEELIKLQVDYSQGFYFAKPMSVDEFEKLLG